MANFRLKGRDVTVRITQDGALLATLTAIRSATFEPQVDVTEEGYLGEVADRYDEIYKGVSGSIEFNPESSDALTLINAHIQKAQGRLPSTTQFNMTMTAVFPNGQTGRITVRDMSFSGIPFNVSAKNAYVTSTIAYKASQPNIAI